MTIESRELFELCKQVYEATGWESDELNWMIDTGSPVPFVSLSPGKKQAVEETDYPVYTSDYLLEKLPKKIKRDSSTGWFDLSPMDSQGAWSAGYEPDHTEHIDDYPMEWGESPVLALLKLTLKLHEEEQL